MLEPHNDYSPACPAVVSQRPDPPRPSELEARAVAHTDDLVSDALYYRFFEQAERVRWRVTDIPWHELDAPAVSDHWKRLVLEIARSELTSFEGSQQFMNRYGGNSDFSQWLAVWFYEETKHPQALMMWLRRLGVKLDSEFMVQGRSSPQFAASSLGTLTSNVITELLASEAYLTLSRHAPEPVLRHIAERIAADDARHAAHFFGYGQRLVARSARPEPELKNALEVLYQWLNTGTRLDHPVGCLLETIEASDPFRKAIAREGFVTESLRQRVCAVVGRMLGFSLAGKADVVRAMRTLLRANAGASTGRDVP